MSLNITQMISDPQTPLRGLLLKEGRGRGEGKGRGREEDGEREGRGQPPIYFGRPRTTPDSEGG